MVSEYLSIPVQTLRNQVCQGTIPFKFMKVGRRVFFDRNDIDQWINSQTRFGGAA